MIETLFDLIDNLPNPIPANAVPYFDGCNWTLITMPGSTSCEDLLSCIDCPFIMSFFSSPNGSIIFNDMGNCGAMDVNPAWINTNVNSSWVNPILTIGNTTHDLSDIFTGNVFWNIWDHISPAFAIHNTDTLEIAGLDGIRFFMDADPMSTTYERLVVGLPMNSIVPDPNNQGAPIPGVRQHGQVLTRDEINGYAYRDNNQCCAQTLWLDEATETLHISGTNSVWLGVLNNQQLAYVPGSNTICISQPNGASQCIDISEVNNHSLLAYPNIGDTNHYFIDLFNDNGVLQSHISLEHMNDQKLSITDNDLYISQPGGLSQHVDLSETNNHTLVSYPAANPLDPTSDFYKVGILNSNSVLQNTVSLAHMNNQILIYDGIANPNLLHISQPDGTPQTVSLDNVNNHRLELVAPDQLSLYNSVNVLMNTITLPTFSCAQVMACTEIQGLVSQINVLAGKVAAAEAQIDLLRAELS